MALHLHRAERTDLLVDGLGTLLADPLPDPFAEELVLVPARGNASRMLRAAGLPN
jgi:exodeoxyribonuclease V gamma subunit